MNYHLDMGQDITLKKGNRVVFVDRDGTIARDVPYCSRPEDFEIFSGVPEDIKRLNEAGFKVIVITNQSGVSRGYFTKETLDKIHQKMVSEMVIKGARIDGIEYCPHKPEDNCWCRKPKTGLFLQAAKKLEIDFPGSFMIGDKPADIEAGHAVGVCTILVPDGTPSSPRESQPDFAADNFTAAVDWILSH